MHKGLHTLKRVRVLKHLPLHLILGKSVLTTDNIQELLQPFKLEEEKQDDRQLYFDFEVD